MQNNLPAVSIASILVYNVGWIAFRVQWIRYLTKLLPMFCYIAEFIADYDRNNVPAYRERNAEKSTVFVLYLLGDLWLMLDDQWPALFGIGVLFFALAHIVYYNILFPNEKLFYNSAVSVDWICIVLGILCLLFPFPTVQFVCVMYGTLLLLILFDFQTRETLHPIVYGAFALFAFSDLLLLFNLFLHLTLLEFLSINLYWVAASLHFYILSSIQTHFCIVSQIKNEEQK